MSELAEQIADMQLRIEELEHFKDLAIRTFDYPREIEMQGAGLTMQEKAYLYRTFEDYQQRVLEPRRKAVHDERENS